MAKKILYRVSLVKMLFAKTSHKKGDTPEPFVEIRSFIILDKKPTILEEKICKKGLEAVIKYTETLFDSLHDAKRANSLDQPFEGNLEKDMIRTQFPASTRPVMEIDGYEVEKVDVDEVSKFFKDNKLKMNEVYRYVGFYNMNGNINFEYDEDDIKHVERISNLARP